MIFFLIISFSYISLLVLIKPEPESLKASPVTYYENFKQIRASLFVGLIILCVFLFVSRFKFDEIDDDLFNLLSLSKQSKDFLLPIQIFSHWFVHINFIHVFTNVTGIGLASVYERRVGARRYLAVLIVGCLTSTFSIFFYPATTGVVGISGGVFGLAAAYFTDYSELTTKEWIYGILLFVFLMALFAVQGQYLSNPAVDFNFQVDHMGHVLGALGAIVYCRVSR